jgi:hypothetical protein
LGSEIKNKDPIHGMILAEDLCVEKGEIQRILGILQAKI